MTDEQVIQQKITLAMLTALGQSSRLASLIHFPVITFLAWIFYQPMQHTYAVFGWAVICMALSLFCTFCAQLLTKLTVQHPMQRHHVLTVIAGFVFGLYCSLGVVFFFSGMSPLWQCTLLSVVILLIVGAAFTFLYSPWVFFSFVTATMGPVWVIGYIAAADPVVRITDMALFFSVCLLLYWYVQTYTTVKKKIQHDVRMSFAALDRARLLRVLAHNVLVTQQDVVCQVYQRTSALFGYGPQQLIGRNIGDLLLDATVVPRLLQKMGFQFTPVQETVPAERGNGTEVAVRHADGLARVAQLFCEAGHTGSGRPIVIWNFENITSRKRAEEVFLAQQAMYRGLVNIAHELLLYLDPALYIVYASERGATRVLGCAAESIIGRSFVDYFGAWTTEEALQYNEDWLQPVLAKGIILNGTVRVRQTSGYVKKLAVYLYPIHGADGHVIGVAATLSDSAGTQHLEEHVLYMATHDALTGLPNRRMITDRLEQAILRIQHTKGYLALLLIDLDLFKDINDTFGHKAGDHVLEVLSLRMRAAVREVGVVARLGGDEYVVLLPEMVEVSAAEGAAQRLLTAVRRPIPFHQHTLQVYASIGISFYPLDGSTFDILMRAADQAMYAAKELGADRYVFSQRRSAEQISAALL